MPQSGKKINHRIYEPKIKQLAKINRTHASDAEKKLWFELRNNSKGFKFRRQFSINNKYIVDFICLEKRLIIEADGGQHNDNAVDLERTAYLEKENFRIIRFWNNEILSNMDVCLEVLYNELNR